MKTSCLLPRKGMVCRCHLGWKIKCSSQYLFLVTALTFKVCVSERSHVVFIWKYIGLGNTCDSRKNYFGQAERNGSYTHTKPHSLQWHRNGWSWRCAYSAFAWPTFACPRHAESRDPRVEGGFPPQPAAHRSSSVRITQEQPQLGGFNCQEKCCFLLIWATALTLFCTEIYLSRFTD